MYKSHKTDMDRVIEEYKASTDEGLVNFAQSVRDGVPDLGNKRYYVVGGVSERAVEDVNNLTGIDIKGYRHIIKGSSVVHIEDRHGVHGEHDHTMADINDYGRMKYVLDNYDNVEILIDNAGDVVFSDEHKDSNNKQATLIRYEKRVNGNICVVEAVPAAKAKRLYVVSMYKNSGGQVPDVYSVPGLR